MPKSGSQRPGRRPQTSQWAQTARAWSIGVDFALSVVGMGLVGWLLDRWLGWSPWLTLGFALVGLIGGFYRFLKEATRLSAGPRNRHKP